MIDVFSRYGTGWMVADRESAELAKRFIEDTLQKDNIPAGQLTIHAGRGKVMRSKPVAFLMAGLGVAKTCSRPYVTNDIPYLESQFRTLKYRPGPASRIALEPSVLVQAVKRNIARFPEDLMFPFSKEELENWLSQIMTSNPEAKRGCATRLIHPKV